MASDNTKRFYDDDADYFPETVEFYTPPVEKMDKVHNLDAMSSHFPVDESLRSSIWAMGGNTEEATAERDAALQIFVPFDQCVATQDYCDEDKVQVYLDDPTAKGFAPMAHRNGDTYIIQDGHHRAVASKMRGLAGMEMNVLDLNAAPIDGELGVPVNKKAFKVEFSFGEDGLITGYTKVEI